MQHIYIYMYIIHIYTMDMSGNLAIFKGHQQNGGKVNRGGGGLLASSPPSNHNQSTIEQKADGSTPRASLELLSIRTPRGSLPVKLQQGLTRFPRLTRAQGGGGARAARAPVGTPASPLQTHGASHIGHSSYSNRADAPPRLNRRS